MKQMGDAGWNERSAFIRSRAVITRRVGFLVAVAFAAVLQLLWWEHKSLELGLDRVFNITFFATLTIGMVLYLPRQIGLPYWPTMNVICGFVICAFVFIPTDDRAVVFSLVLFASLPSMVFSQAALYWISRPVAERKVNRSE